MSLYPMLPNTRPATRSTWHVADSSGATDAESTMMTVAPAVASVARTRSRGSAGSMEDCNLPGNVHAEQPRDGGGARGAHGNSGVGGQQRVQLRGELVGEP